MEEGFYSIHTHVLFDVARTAYGRTQSAESDLAPGQDDALVAILFSAATLEAFITYLALVAEMGQNLFGRSASGRVVAEVLEETEESRGSVRLKFLLAKAVLTGRPYDKGSRPYQDFDLLFRLRDAIVHMKPERLIEKPSPIIERMLLLKLCGDREANVATSWVHQVSTRATARWACNVVPDIIESFQERFPVEKRTPKSIFDLGFWSSGYDRVK